MKELTVKQAINLPQIAGSLTGVSDRTRETYTIQMNSYQNYCRNNGCKMDLDSLKAWIVSANKPSTQSLRTAAARRVFGELYKGHAQLEELKATIAEIKPVKRDMEVSESKYINAAEFEQIKDTSSQRVKLMLETLYMTGLRISELLNMRHDKCVSIREGKVFEVVIIGKRSKENKVYLTADLYNRIKNCFGLGEYFFEHDNSQYNRKYITAEIKKAGSVVGKNISAHSIRHAFAKKLMDRGVTIDKVSKSLNHASVSTTANFYLHEKASIEDLLDI